MGFDAPDDLPAPLTTQPDVETVDWSSPIVPAAREAEPAWFVDGVRRVELRLVADQDGRRAPGLFGTYAVGSVRCDGRATFGEHAVGRAVILAGGLVPERVEIATPSGALIFEPVTDPGDTPDRPLWKLQDLMRDAEAALSQEVEKLEKQPVTDKELERAKNLLESTLIYGQDSLFYRTMQLGEYASLGDWSLIHKVVPGIRAVTAADVQRVAQTYLREENRTVGLLIPEGTPVRESPDGGLGSKSIH